MLVVVCGDAEKVREMLGIGAGVIWIAARVRYSPPAAIKETDCGGAGWEGGMMQGLEEPGNGQSDCSAASDSRILISAPLLAQPEDSRPGSERIIDRATTSIEDF